MSLEMQQNTAMLLPCGSDAATVFVVFERDHRRPVIRNVKRLWGECNMVMGRAEGMILEASKSPELISAFRLVAETDFDGEPKFSTKICHDLAKAITCRTYATGILELCHLVCVADRVFGGYERLFWEQIAARGHAYRAMFQDACGGENGTGFKQSFNCIDAVYPDGCFTITYGRMAYLGALMEFLVTTVGYAAVDDVFKGLAEPSLTAKSVSAQANALSRRLYDYLKDHLPTVQAQRKFRQLIGFLETCGEGDFAITEMGDDVVMEFWCAQSLDVDGEGADFKTYAAVFRAFVRLRQTLSQASDLVAMENASGIGTDREAGEVDPDTLLGLVEQADEYRSPLLALLDDPASAIKFMNKRETEAVALLCECGPAALNFPLSLMRVEVFGKGQSRLTQAVRNKTTPEQLMSLSENCAGQTYEERQGEYRDVLRHMRKVLLASLHVLAGHKNQNAISIILGLAPELDLAKLARVLEEEGEGRLPPPKATL